MSIIVLSCTSAANSARSSDVLVCQRINAKQLPQDFKVDAMAFTGPSGDGRRGSAGLVVPIEVGEGSRFAFTFQRDASDYGFQAIHPLGKGHVLVSVHSRGVTLYRGGSWGAIGWGNPATSEPLELNADAKSLLPLNSDTTYPVVSQLSADGEYRLSIDGKLLCRHTLKSTTPLVLEVPQHQSVWGGSGYDRKQFAGAAFQPRLKQGDAGLILGPMDGSGPKQNFQDIRLTQLPGNAPVRTAPYAGFEALFQAVDNAGENGSLVKSKTADGNGGGMFEQKMIEPTLLVGFDYTLSRFYGGHLTIKSLRPVYATPQGEKLGKWCGVPHGTVYREAAKEGYVVTAMVAKHGHRLDGMRLIYMQVRGRRLNPDVTYRSNWLGGKGGGEETLLATYCNPVVSVFGRRGHDLDAIGFV